MDTLRRWHFEDLIKESNMSRERVHTLLKELCNEYFIQRVNPKNKMPYYLANKDLSKFRSEKRLYGLKLLEESGLFENIISCKEIKTAILFGSFARGNWTRSSDIDIFIFGKDTHFEKGKFELKLKREIQLFTFDDAKKMKKELDPKLIPNISNGFHITSDFEPFKVIIDV